MQVGVVILFVLYKDWVIIFKANIATGNYKTLIRG